MNSPRLGPRGRISARETPRSGTPASAVTGNGPPVAKGTLVLGRSKARFRDGIDTSTSSIAPGQQVAMDISREGTAIEGEADVSFTSSKRSGYHTAGRIVGERGRTFAKSDEIAASFHEGLPLEILKAMGMDSKSCSPSSEIQIQTSIKMHGEKRTWEDTTLVQDTLGWRPVAIHGYGNTTFVVASEFCPF